MSRFRAENFASRIPLTFSIILSIITHHSAFRRTDEDSTTLKFPLIIFILACLPLSAAAQQDFVTINAYNAIKEEVTLSTEEWMNAYNSNDVEKLADFYAEDADYVSPHVPGLIIHGREQIKENFRQGIAGGGHIDSIAVQRSGSSCDLAYLVCAYQATNSGVTVHGKNVLVMKRVGTRWLILTQASIVRD
jgi:uncharacterized protein (TIGR02246 family)